MEYNWGTRYKISDVNKQIMPDEINI